MCMKFERQFCRIKGEENRYKEEVDSFTYMQNEYLDERECKRKAKSEMRFFQAMVEEEVDLAARFYEYGESFHYLSFYGKLIIKPYNSLYEAVLDGIKGFYDVGLMAEAITTDIGYLFAIKIPGKEDKAFGYVLYDSEGNIVKARQAFNLDIENGLVLKYLNLFSRDILLPYFKKQKEEKTA